jgi:hypothetical protein
VVRDTALTFSSVIHLVIMLIWCLLLQGRSIGNTSRLQLAREEVGEAVSVGWWGFDGEMWEVVDWG